MVQSNSKLYKLYMSLKSEIASSIAKQGFSEIERLELVDYEGELMIAYKTKDGFEGMYGLNYKEQKQQQ